MIFIINFIGGLNGTIGLSFGMVQLGVLGSQAIKYTWYAFKYVLGKIFNMKNITVPLGYLLVLLGIKGPSKEKVMMDQIWQASSKSGLPPGGPP